MIILRKKKHIKYLGIVLLIITITLTAFSTTSLPAHSSAKLTIVIDAGHGGIDFGVSGVISKTPESEINLIITKKLEKLLLNNNFKVILTRKDENGLYGDKSPGFKRRDMQERKRIIEEANADLVISIHANRFPDSSDRWAKAFYEPMSENSMRLAQNIQNNLNILNKAEINRDHKPRPGDYNILKCSHLPSTIIETGFLSNPEDDRLLNDDDYQNKIAYAIFSGIVSYFASDAYTTTCLYNAQ